MNPRILVCYVSRHGQTAKIAEVLARELEALGHEVDLEDIDQISPKIRVAAYEGVIAGAPVYLSRHPTRFRRWIRDHAKSLSARPGAFFSVGLGGSEAQASAREEAEHLADRFLADTGWSAGQREVFAGAFLFSKYGWLTRLFMQNVARRCGVADDHDRELTDWNQVRAFAEEFSNRVRRRWRPVSPSVHAPLTEQSPGPLN